jgi:hypothetical protein
VGSNNQILTADSAQADGVKWANGSAATLTTTGDTLYASAANTPARLGIGSTGQVLTVASGLPSWATPSSGGMTLINAGGTTLSGASVTISSIPSTYTNLLIVLSNYYNTTGNAHIYIQFNADSGANYTYSSMFLNNVTYSAFSEIGGTSAYIQKVGISANTSGSKANTSVQVYRYTDTTDNKFYSYQSSGVSSTNACSTVGSGNYQGTSAISSVTVFGDSNFSGGTIYVYGVK